jgi:hypothetical protein
MQLYLALVRAWALGLERERERAVGLPWRPFELEKVMMDKKIGFEREMLTSWIEKGVRPPLEASERTWTQQNYG